MMVLLTSSATSTITPTTGSLPSFRIDPETVTVSGVSGGAYFAIMVSTLLIDDPHQKDRLPQQPPASIIGFAMVLIVVVVFTM